MTETFPDARRGGRSNARGLSRVRPRWHLRRWAEDVHSQAPRVELVGRPARIAAENVWLDACTENDIQTTGRYVDGDEIVDCAVMTGVHSGPLPLQLQDRSVPSRL